MLDGEFFVWKYSHTKNKKCLSAIEYDGDVCVYDIMWIIIYNHLKSEEKRNV